MRKYLISYDIENNRLRTQISKILVRYGFYRIQLSVYCGIAKRSTIQALEQLLRSKKYNKSDSVVIIPINKVSEINRGAIEDLELDSEVIII